MYVRQVTELKMNSGWKTTLLTSVFFIQTSVFLASCYYADSIDTDVKYGCLQMLDWLVSTHHKKIVRRLIS
jgi:hypothetical protein